MSLRTICLYFTNSHAGQVPVAGAYNLSYLGGWDQGDQGSRSAWANSSQDSISKMARAKWTEGVAQEVEYWFCKCETLSSNPSPTKIYLYINIDTNMCVCAYKTWKHKNKTY
jgi:hypothetical protein